MVTEALAEKEESFFAAHGTDTDHDLLMYFRNCADELGHTPRRHEFIGWKLIEHRFGSVDSAAEKAQMPSYKGPVPISECALIRKEYETQRAIYEQKKKDKSRKTELRKQLQAKRRKEQEQWLAEHKGTKPQKEKRGDSKE